jgi:hypothetical protein
LFVKIDGGLRCCAFGTPGEKTTATKNSIDVGAETQIRFLTLPCEYICVSGRAVSFQIAILKILNAQPEGLASLADLKQYLAILTTSGSDWTARMKRLSACAPELDIFGSKFVLRDGAGWQITDAGRAFISMLEAPDVTMAKDERSPEKPVGLLPPPPAPPVRLVGINVRRVRKSHRGRRVASPKLRSA